MRRRAGTYQGIGTVIAGAVTVATVVTGDLMAGDTDGDTDVPSGTGAEPQDASTPRAGGAEAMSTATGYAQRVVELVNTERARYGCPPVRVNSTLRTAAQGHAPPPPG
ncbi:hypothetical protein QWM81_12950 [Streptomyces ficellus]|uniref:CAP domain-containing protein n=1 Tax=Streptomyces ficellus TaxID=1977088 RepID=A0ABT7Z606_9ACTN|nr:hypothetical protein [Streptomyces ficellus]MDN3294943.1 hypothetical protein [Streptomyces ficellus]